MSADLFCDYCGRKIPRWASAYTNARRHKFHHCNRAHDVARRKRAGFYKKISLDGRDARVQAVTRSNSENPRRKKKSE